MSKSTMTIQDKEIGFTRQELKRVMEEKHWTMTRVANAVDLSGSTLSSFMSGDYKGDNKAIAKAVRSFLAREALETRPEGKSYHFVETSVARRIHAAADYAHGGRIVIVFGNSGLGKTKALNAYRRRFSNAIHIKANVSYTARVLLTDICLKLKLDPRGHLNTLLKQIVEKLKGADRLILIDQAEYLPYKAIDLLRTIHDETGDDDADNEDSGRVGILYCGMPRLNNQFRDKPDYRQHDNRVRLRVDLDYAVGKKDSSKSDAEKIVRMNAPAVMPIFESLYKASRRDWRRMDSLVDNCLILMAKDDSEATDEILLDAISYVDHGGEEGGK